MEQINDSRLIDNAVDLRKKGKFKEAISYVENNLDKIDPIFQSRFLLQAFKASIEIDNSALVDRYASLIQELES